MAGGQILTWSTVFKMKTRLSRLLCSKTFLLSILSFLGIFELGRNIFGQEETFQEYSENIMANGRDLQIKLSVPNNKIETNKETTLNKDNPEMAADNPVVAKNPTSCLCQVFLNSFIFVITSSSIPLDLGPHLLGSCYPLVLKRPTSMSHCLA